MIGSVKIVGISFLFFMLATYISFQMGWSFWYSYEFFKFLRYIELPHEGWYFLDRYIYNGEL
jgi:hypothetical protein